MTTRPFRLKPPEIPEQELHEAVADLLGKLLAPPAQWACYPSGALPLPPAYAAKLSRMGLQRGWPDFLVLYERCYGIELKRAGGALSKTRIVRTRRGAPRELIGQTDRFPMLKAAGMADIAICRSVDEVIATLGRWAIPMRWQVVASVFAKGENRNDASTALPRAEP